MLYLLLITTTLMQSGKSLLFKKIGVDYQSNKQFFGLNGFSFGVAAVIAALIACFKLDSLLKLAGLVYTGGEAKEVSQAGQVLYHGEICTPRGKKVREGDTVQYNNQTVKVVKE